MFDQSRDTVRLQAWSLANGVVTDLAVEGTPPYSDEILFVTYDAAQDRAVFVTGRARNSRSIGYVNLSGTPRWHRIASAGGHDTGGAIAYDSRRRRLVFMGGTYGSSAVQVALDDVDTYSIDDGSWEDLNPTGAAGRFGHSLVYDSRRDRLIAYGGRTRAGDWIGIPSVLVGEVLELPLTGPRVWRPSTVGPLRSNHSAVYDSLGDRMIVFGGADANRALQDTWILNLSFGSEPSTIVNPPPARVLHSAVFDPVGNRMLVHGGYTRAYADALSDLWSLSLDGFGWTDLSSAVVGPMSTEGQALMDPISGDPLFLIVASQSAGQAWRLDSSGHWSRRALAPGPPRYTRGVADPPRRRIVTFGGLSGPASAELWELQGDWRPLAAGEGPEPRYGHAVAYDPIRERMIVYGGYTGNNSVLSSTWELSLRGTPRWSPLPWLAGRAHAVATYDTRRDRMILIGGSADHREFRETWTYSDAHGWVLLTQSAPQRCVAAAYDSLQDRAWALTPEGHLYGLDLAGPPQWVLEEAPNAHGLWIGLGVIDLERRRLVVHGQTSNGYWHETWIRPMGCGALALGPDTLADAVLERSYQGRIVTPPTARGSFHLDGGALPPGLRIDAASGVISGTPSASGRFSFEVAFIDTKECPSRRAYSLLVRPLLTRTESRVCIDPSTSGRVGFTLSSRDDPAIRRWTARVALDPGLVPSPPCDEHGCPAVRAGDLFGNRPQSLTATPRDDGTIEISGAVEDGDCAPRPDGALLFTVDVALAPRATEGMVVVRSATVEHCAGAPIALAGDAGTRVAGPGPSQRVSGLEARRVTSSSFQSPLRVTFVRPALAQRVEVYRAGFGNYPEFDDSVTAGSRGAPPAAPGHPPGPPWQLTSVTSPGGLDTVDTRDFYSYVAFAIDSCGQASLVSEISTPVPNYRLGDFSGPNGGCSGDGQVNSMDLAFLSEWYGQPLADPGPDPRACLDIGPTSAGGVDGRPVTDDRIDFEDLTLLALQDSASTAGPAAYPDAAWLRVPASPGVGETFVVTLEAAGARSARAVHFELAYEAEVVEWVACSPGRLLGLQAGPAVALSPRPGAIDVAVLGANLAGRGEVAQVTFRLKRSAAPNIRLIAAEARGAANQRLAFPVREGIQSPPTAVAMDCFPNPASTSLSLSLSLPTRGPVELGVFDLLGRRVRALAHGEEAAGQRIVHWDGRDDAGAQLAPGLYVVRLSTGARVIVKRVALVR